MKITTDQRISNGTILFFMTRCGVGSTDFLKNSITFTKVSIFIFCIMVLTCGCATVYNPATQREEFIFIDTAQEVSLGRNFSRQIEQELDVSENAILWQRVNAIGQKIAHVSHRQDLVYHFSVINDKEINAFAVPGGYIYVNTGLLQMADDDELASVIAHEVGHVAAKHSVKALQAALGYQLLTGLIFQGEKYQSALQTGNIVFNLMHLNYSRADELFADKLGIHYVSLAGFDPQGMIHFFQKLKLKQKKEGSSEGIFLLRSHPYVDQRIEAAKKEIDLLGQRP